MGGDGELTRQLQVGVREAVGRRQKVTFAKVIQIEVKSDKFDTRIVAVTEHRLFILTAKLPLKVEQNVHLLDISHLQLKSPDRLLIGWQSKQYTLCLAGGSEADGCRHSGAVTQLAQHIINTLVNLFPAASPSKLISSLDVPDELVTRIISTSAGASGTSLQGGVARAAEEKPCGNFSAAYRCMCDYLGVDFMEDVVWDIDTIYLSHGSRELCLSDFDHLEGRNLIPIISALTYNRWFTKLNASSVKLNADSLNEILSVLKINSTIEGLILCNLNLRLDFVQKLAAAILSNPSSAVNSLDLSGNPIEDKGILHICGLITKLPTGPVQLNFARCSVSGKATNRIAESLVSNGNSQYTLRHLDLSENSLKADDLTHLHNMLAQLNSVTHLRLANCECPLENLFGALLRGCTQNLESLDLSGNVYSTKRSGGKDVVVPLAWKQFFSSSIALRGVNFSNNRLPLEAVKSILLGIGSNVTLRDVELDLSANGLGGNAAYCQMLEVCLPNVNNICSLNLSDNGFENALSGIVTKLGQNRCIRKLAIGRNFTNIKPKHIPKVLDAIVQMIQEEESPIESLLLDDLHLKSDATILINALGSNATLREIDITGNQMGDTGARMLAKALQINKRLSVIHWDNNFTTPNGFHDIAAALEKNYTLRKMPVPLNDASVALKINPEKTQNALKKIDDLLQRNQVPQKFSADQAYRLQQGFLMSSVHQSLDRSLVRVQHSVSKLESSSNQLSAQALEAVTRAKALIAESNAACQLLLHLQKVAESSEREGGTLDNRVVRLADELKQTVDGQLLTNIESMLKCVQSLCPNLIAQHKDEKGVPLVSTDTLKCSSSQIALSQTFISTLVVEQLGTDLSNKMSELNLAAAARLSDRVLDAVIEALDKCASNLEALLKSHSAADGASTNRDVERQTRDQSGPISDQMGGARSLGSVSTIGDEDLDLPADMPEVMDKNATLRQRRRRPQSSIDPADVRTALNAVHLTTALKSCETSSASSRENLDDEESCSSGVERTQGGGDQVVDQQEMTPVAKPRKKKVNLVQLSVPDSDTETKIDSKLNESGVGLEVKEESSAEDGKPRKKSDRLIEGVSTIKPVSPIPKRITDETQTDRDNQRRVSFTDSNDISGSCLLGSKEDICAIPVSPRKPSRTRIGSHDEDRDKKAFKSNLQEELSKRLGKGSASNDEKALEDGLEEEVFEGVGDADEDESREAMMSHEQRRRLSSPTAESNNSRREPDELDTTDESLSESSVAATAGSAHGRDGRQNGATSTPTSSIPAKPSPSHRPSFQGRRPPTAPPDLPVFSTEAPRLEHLGAARPRRARNHAVTRPTVATGHDQIEDDMSSWVKENGFSSEEAAVRGTERQDSSNQSSGSAAGGQISGKKGRSILSPKFDSSKQIAAGFKSLFGGKKSTGGAAPSPAPQTSSSRTPQEVLAKASTLPNYTGESPGSSRGLVAGSEAPPAVLVSSRRLPSGTSEESGMRRDEGEPVRKGPLPRPPPIVKKPESSAPPHSDSLNEAAAKKPPAVPLPFDRNQPLRKSSDELRRSPARQIEANQSEEFGTFERNTPLRKTSDMVLGGRTVNQVLKQSELGGAKDRLTGEAGSGLKKTGSLKSTGGPPQRPALPVIKAEGGRRSLDELSVSDTIDDTSAGEPKAKPRPAVVKSGLPAVSQSGSAAEPANDKSRPAVKSRPPPPLAPKPAAANRNRLSSFGVLSAESGSTQKSGDNAEVRDSVDGEGGGKVPERPVSRDLPLDSNSNVKLETASARSAAEESAVSVTGDQSAVTKRDSAVSGNQSDGSIVDDSSAEDQSDQSIPSGSKAQDLTDVVYV